MDTREAVSTYGGIERIPVTHMLGRHYAFFSTPIGESCCECHAEYGAYHDPDCDCELCPICLRQRNSCGCLPREPKP